MENAPIIPATPELNLDSSEKKDKKKKKRGFEFGRAAVEEPKAEKRGDDKKPEVSAESKDTKDVVETKVVESKESLDKESAMEAAIAETQPASEAEAPNEQVGEAEASEIQPQLAEIAREMDPEPDPVVEHFRDKIIEEGKDTETAYAETMSELGMDTETEEARREGEVEPDAPEGGSEETDVENGQELNEDEGELIIQRSPELGSETGTEDEDNPLTTTAGAAGAGVAAGAAATRGGANVPPTARAGGGTGGGLPPHGPLPPFGPGGYNPGGPPGGMAGFNTTPTPVANPNARAHNYDYLDDRASPAAMALFGGIIGYLIGRRRGRIKTEKKLLPIQKKLEKQVNNLQRDLKEKESKLRKAAAEKVSQDPTIIEKFTPAPAIVAKRAERAQRHTEQRRKAPEARQLHANQKSPERIGHMLMAAEAVPIVRTERSRTETERSVQKATEKLREVPPELMNERRVETLNRVELLALSEKIIVGGSSLRQIYETRLIGERGLRRLIAEHLKGGDIQKALRREIVEREIDFERDPALRDMSTASAAGGGATGKAALDQLVQQASANMPHDDEETAYYRARATYESDQYKQQQRHRQVMDFSMVAIILILIGLVVLLVITRS